MYSNLHVESRVILVTLLSSARDSIVNAESDTAEKQARGTSLAASRSSRRTISPGEIECLKILRAPGEGRVPDLLAVLVEDRRVLRIFGAKYRLAQGSWSRKKREKEWTTMTVKVGGFTGAA